MRRRGRSLLAGAPVSTSLPRIATAAASGRTANAALAARHPTTPGRERHPDPSHEATADERTDVPPHHALTDPRHERLDDVRRADHEQTRHAEALERATHEEKREGRRERNPEGGRHEQPAREADRARPADPIGERPPEPGADRRARARPSRRTGRPSTARCRTRGRARGESPASSTSWRTSPPHRAESPPFRPGSTAAPAPGVPACQCCAATPRWRTCAPVSTISTI